MIGNAQCSLLLGEEHEAVPAGANQQAAVVGTVATPAGDYPASSSPVRPEWHFGKSDLLSYSPPPSILKTKVL